MPIVMYLSDFTAVHYITRNINCNSDLTTLCYFTVNSRFSDRVYTANWVHISLWCLTDNHLSCVDRIQCVPESWRYSDVFTHVVTCKHTAAQLFFFLLCTETHYKSRFPDIGMFLFRKPFKGNFPTYLSPLLILKSQPLSLNIVLFVVS